MYRRGITISQTEKNTSCSIIVHAISWGHYCMLRAGSTLVQSESKPTALTLQHRASWLSTHCTCKEARLKVNVLKITMFKKTGEKKNKMLDESEKLSRRQWECCEAVGEHNHKMERKKRVNNWLRKVTDIHPNARVKSCMRIRIGGVNSVRKCARKIKT